MVKRKVNSEQNEKNNVSNDPSIHDFSDEEKQKFQRNLITWYEKNKRDLPWRKQLTNADTDQRAYAVWVSEIMLQQTQVATVINYYNRWMEKWPTLQDLAKATLEEVNEMWSGLGYYSRGRRLLEGAQKVVRDLNGKMPRSAESLLKQLPGVGRYTAGAIASIAYSQVTGLVDGNVVRVFCRMRAIGGDSTSQAVQTKLWSLAESVVDSSKPGDFNQGLMELGATVCTPKNPSCRDCPVQDLCHAFTKVEQNRKMSETKLGLQLCSSVPDIECGGILPGCWSEIIIYCCHAVSWAKSCQDAAKAVKNCLLCLPDSEPWEEKDGVQNFPRKGKKKAAREERTHVCIVCKKVQNGDTQYLLTQRPDKGLLAGLWEFPSFQIKDDEDEDLGSKEILHESIKLKINNIQQQRKVGEVVHIFSHIHQTYVIQSITVDEEDVDSSHCQSGRFRWVTREQLFESAISTAMKKVFKTFEGQGLKVKKVKVADSKQPSISAFFRKK